MARIPITANPPDSGWSLPSLEPYAERQPEREDALQRWVAALTGVVTSRSQGLRRARLRGIVAAVEKHGESLRRASDAELQEQIAKLRPALRRRSEHDVETVSRSFALIREASTRVLGLRHFPVQLIGGFALLKGMVAEMNTGEGKTLTATLTAATAALGGQPVHIVTVNDYLARRDATDMGPLYQFLGLSVGTVLSEQADAEKRSQYACDVVYCTNKTVAFDYMRDRLKRGRRLGALQTLASRISSPVASRSPEPVMRGLHFAIVDEADSVLVDEARTPLVISGEVDPPVPEAMLEQTMALAKALSAGEDFRLAPTERRVELTEAGAAKLAARAETLGGRWRVRALREELVRHALAANYLFHRDQAYLVRDGKIVIVDEYTGRVMADRQWSQGLHQLIELKEGCEITRPRITLARMTYQRFFRRYNRLAGMTGTAQEVSYELWRVYGLPVVRVPPNRPSRRRGRRAQIVETQEQKWELIASRIASLTERGRPVLLGTRSVAASSAASAALARHGLSHAVLSAAQDEGEAEIIARAGEPGRITIATNMAGRGTDIRLAPGVAESGGLHVILSERHEAGRIDRQLLGRCGRQGEPGSYEAILSLEDPLLDLTPWTRWYRRLNGRVSFLEDMLHRNAQRYAEARHSRMRRDLLRQTDLLGDSLAFAGAPD